jgi:hypothetical protein
LLWRGVNPLAVLANQILQSIDRFGFRDIELHRRLPDVEVNFPRGSTDVAKIRIRHFARPVHDATHDRDFDSFEMYRRRFNPRGRRLEIEERATARWTRDVVGLENPRAGGLQDIVAETQRLARRLFPLHENGIADAIAKERANVSGRNEKRAEEIRLGRSRNLQRILKHDRMVRRDFRR